jgi:hypothetical protein
MRFVRFVCSSAILINVLVLAQSSRTPAVNQTNGLPIAQQRHPAPPPNLFQPPQGPPSAQRGAGTLKATPNRRRTLSMQGLDFTPAVAYDSGGVGSSLRGCGGRKRRRQAGLGGGEPVRQLQQRLHRHRLLGVLLGNGDGTFQTAVTYRSGAYRAESVVVADVNGDEKPDIVVTNLCMNEDCSNGNGSVSVLLGNGDGTFQTAVTYSSGGYNATSVSVADVNGDGKPELLVANYYADVNGDNSSVGVLLGNGDGTFQAAVSYDSGGLVFNMGILSNAQFGRE